MLVFHGALKLANLEGFAQMLPISYLQVVLAALAETGGGLLVLVAGHRIWRSWLTQFISNLGVRT